MEQMITTRHIGIVAVSAEGAALCYRTICIEAVRVMGTQSHPEITMHTFPLRSYMAHVERARWDEVGKLLLTSAGKLAKTGVELLICPDNTVHQGLDLVLESSPLPWLHIAEEVTTRAVDLGFKQLAVLGTQYLMEGSVYPRTLSAKGVRFKIPRPEDRQRIDAIIFSELVNGRFEPGSRRYFQEVIRYLGSEGCDGVVLGCTEIPLLISDSDSPLPVLDSTRILARAALREAICEADA
jgi:aspartate racemase